MRKLLAGALLLLAACDPPAPAPGPGPGSPAPTAAPTPPPTPTPVAVRRRVVLKVQSDTWREGEKPHDIGAELREALAPAGLAVVEEADPAREALVLVTWSEKRGAAYSSFGMGPTTGYGTNLEIALDVLTPKGEVLLRLSRRAGTPSSVSGNAGLYESAISAARGVSAIRRAAEWIDAALGSTEALGRLLPLLADKDEREPLLGLAGRLGYAPADGRSRAWLALGRDDGAALRALGKDAVEPLLEFLGKYWWASDCAKAAALLAEIGDPRAAKAVVERAVALPIQSGAEDDELLVSLLESAGKLGDAFAIAPLEELARKLPDDFGRPSPAVVAAAGRAVASIRARLAGGK